MRAQEVQDSRFMREESVFIASFPGATLPELVDLSSLVAESRPPERLVVWWLGNEYISKTVEIPLLVHSSFSTLRGISPCVTVVLPTYGDVFVQYGPRYLAFAQEVTAVAIEWSRHRRHFKVSTPFGLEGCNLKNSQHR